MAGERKTQAGRPAFSILICPDSLLARRQMERMLAGDAGAWARHVYWGDDEPPPRFWEQLSLRGLFATPRLLVLRRAQLWRAEVWQEISRGLEHVSAQAWPFFYLELPWEKGRPKIPAHIAKLPCMALAEKNGWVWRHPGLTEKNIPLYVRDRLKANSLHLDAGTMEQLCAQLPADATAIENEIQKLALLLPGKTQGENGADGGSAGQAAARPVSATPPDIFACVRHMEEGNLAALFLELAHDPDRESLFFPLTAVMEREFRQLWQLLAGEKVSLPPFALGTKKRLAQRLGRAGLARCLACLAEAEWQVKSGRATVEQSLDFLLVQLARLCAP